MSRSQIKPIVQPNEYSCGPSSIKIAARLLGKEVSLKRLIRLCQTTSRGTSLSGMVKAINRLGFSVLELKNCSRAHLQSALKTRPNARRAVIVDYLYADSDPIEETGHFATVAGYSDSRSRIVLFDSYSGTKKTYLWTKFLPLWKGYETHRVKAQSSPRYLRFYRRWTRRSMLIIAKQAQDLPRFSLAAQKIYLPG